MLVDTFDQMCSNYSVARISSRWPMRIFYGMLDQSGVNSNIIYNLNPNFDSMVRKDFLRELGFDLIKPHLRTRLQIPTLRIVNREMIRNILQLETEHNNKPIRFEDQKRHFCTCCPPIDKKKKQYGAVRIV